MSAEIQEHLHSTNPFERLTPPHPRVQELHRFWEEDKKKLVEEMGRPMELPSNDTSDFTEEAWESHRETIAQNWAYLEQEAHRGEYTYPEVRRFLATILQGFHHEEHFLNEVAERVDELLTDESSSS